MENEDIFYINQQELKKSVIKLHLCGITYPNKNYEISRAYSEYAVIEYVESGKGVICIHDKTYSVQAGDSYLLQTATKHHYYSDARNPWKKLFINFGGPFAEKLIEAYGLENTSYFPLLDIKEELTKIIEAAEKSEEDRTTYISALINEILMKMYLHINQNNTVSKTALDMKNFLNARITADFSIKELCEFVSKSESQTINIFKKEYGTTPYAYLLDKKINFAKTMLKNTGLSIKEIAYKLHFTDEYYFSGLFKRKVGTSPKNYQKAQRSNLLKQTIDISDT